MVNVEPGSSAAYFAAKANLLSVSFVVLFTFLGVKALAFLPERYYFTFSQLVDSRATSTFIVEAPGVTASKYCDILIRKGYIPKAKYTYDSSDDTCNITVPSETVSETPATTEERPQVTVPPAPDAPAEPATDAEDVTTPDETATEGTETSPEQSEGEDQSTDTMTTTVTSALTDEQLLDLNREITASGKFNLWIALLLKLLPPFLAGFLCYVVWKYEALIAAPIGAALVAFILCWPMIVMWENVVIDPDIDRKRNLFMGLYIAYVAMYYFVAKFGTQAARLAVDSKLVKVSGPSIDIWKLASSLVGAIITTIITLTVTEVLAAPQ